MKDYYSLPVLTQAVKFEYGNWEEIIKVIGLNGVSARGVYLTKEGDVAPEGTFTEFRAIKIGTGRPSEVLVAVLGDYIVKSEDEVSCEFFPVPADIFEKMYVDDTRLIGNGQHTFGQLYKQLEDQDESLRLLIDLLSRSMDVMLAVSKHINHPIKDDLREVSQTIAEVLRKPEPSSPLKIVE